VSSQFSHSSLAARHRAEAISSHHNSSDRNKFHLLQENHHSLGVWPIKDAVASGSPIQPNPLALCEQRVRNPFEMFQNKSVLAK
jgi:hypothetical protein